jgi:hypothetical protein
MASAALQLPARERTAIERFAEKCRFDPVTGCVLWIGGTTSAQLATALYGVFWFEGRRWCAHRWAALHIHGLTIDGFEVDHCCPLAKPNTLCVQHLQAVTGLRNLELMWGRRKWGWDEWGDDGRPEPEAEPEPAGVPFYAPPGWLAPFMPRPSTLCPF